eukprot:m.376638 g.376638  ORF g.376638 m.376638 type:complete len:141 (+) comp20017_c9_seq2:315-737(+)
MSETTGAVTGSSGIAEQTHPHTTYLHLKYGRLSLPLQCEGSTAESLLRSAVVRAKRKDAIEKLVGSVDVEQLKHERGFKEPDSAKQLAEMTLYGAVTLPGDDFIVNRQGPNIAAISKEAKELGGVPAVIGRVSDMPGNPF